MAILRILLGKHPYHLWALSAVLMIVVAGLAYFDPQFESLVRHLWLTLSEGSVPSATATELAARAPSNRVVFALVGLVFVPAVLALSLVLYGTFLGPKPYRSLKSAIGLMSLFCLWTGLAFSLSNIAWYGKQARVRSLLNRLEPIVEELNAQWPEEDSESPTLGPFKAYPLTNPTTLILLISPALPESKVRLTEVTRTGDNELRFLLAGSEYGDWLEWHPPGSQPDSFQGGLGEQNQLVRYDKLDTNWFLVRYNR